MSKIYLVSDGTPAPAAPRPERKTYKPRDKKVSSAEMARVIRTADSLGLTIYSFTIDGGVMKVVTKPEQPPDKGHPSEADAWFAAHG